jgi:hypothetical protein
MILKIPILFMSKQFFHPSILDNQEYWQVFENDEHVANFIAYFQSTSSKHQRKCRCILKKEKSVKRRSTIKVLPFFPKNYINLESLFTRDYQTRKGVQWMSLPLGK